MKQRVYKPWREHPKLVYLVNWAYRSRLKYEKHFVTSEDPHPQSPAAALKLREYLQNHSVEGVNKQTEAKRKWKFRDAFVHEQMEKGQLVCYYCGKTKLAFSREKFKLERKKKTGTHYVDYATIDHVHPVSEGADYFDKSNIVIACSKCNNRKGNYKKFDPKLSKNALKKLNRS